MIDPSFIPKPVSTQNHSLGDIETDWNIPYQIDHVATDRVAMSNRTYRARMSLMPGTHTNRVKQG